jgi:uncharacterized membrane protein YheB (UPF0754 family)
MTWSEILDDLRRNWLLYASMPVVAAVIGFVTKILAIEMMFRPIEFVGLKKLWIGWQGIVPRKAATMAAIATDTLTARLLKPEEIFRKLDAERVAHEIEKPLLEAVEEITREVATQFQPGLWESLPESIRALVIRRIQAESPAIVKAIMQDIQKNLDRVFDLKDMVVSNLVKDKPLLNRMFLEAGRGEFRFIRNSGLYFGAAIGVVQALTWAGTHSKWVMPLFGGFTGWFTDWLALKMVFHPKHPTRYLGIFTWQGLFLKRRKEVAAEYGRLIAKEIITPNRILDAILRGPLSDRLFNMVQKVVKKTIDEQAGLALPIVVYAIGSTRYQEMKKLIAQKVVERLPETLKHMEGYAADAMDIENTLVTKMQELTPEEFEGLLRPVFKQDEWILIMVGAMLGFLVGELQVQVMLRLGGLH